ncbi:hypothetical protein V6N13_015992 [Hibiscus sabdariffa]
MDIGPLIHFVGASIAANLRYDTVAEMADFSGDWLWQTFQHVLPGYILLRVAAVKGPKPLILSVGKVAKTKGLRLNQLMMSDSIL